MALKGANETIARQSRKMAISVYHHPSHLYAIPELVLSINPNCELYFEHYMPDLTESVMYFKPIT